MGKGFVKKLNILNLTFLMMLSFALSSNILFANTLTVDDIEKQIIMTVTVVGLFLLLLTISCRNSQIDKKFDQIQDQKKLLATLQKENEQLASKLANQQAGDVFKNVETVSGHSMITAQVKVKDMNQLRQLADQWKQKNISDILVLANEQDGKVSLLVAMTKEANDAGLKAGDLIKAIAPKVGGGGGGRPDMAQAGGKNPAGIPDALSEAKTWLSNQ